MKQQNDWREHIDPATARHAGLNHDFDTMRPLVALAIIVALAVLLVTSVAFGVLPATESGESMMIGA